MSNHTYRIGVIGLPQSGKSSITRRLQEMADEAGKKMAFIESHDLDELHGHSFDVVLQVVDSTRLEESLMLTPHIVDEKEKIVLALSRYDLLLDSDHSLQIGKFSELLGVPVTRVSISHNYGLEELLESVDKVAHQEASNAHPVYHAWEQKDEEAYMGYVHGVLTQTLNHGHHDKKTRIEIIDDILTSPISGSIILAIILGVTFECTFLLGGPLQDWLQMGVDALYELVQTHMAPGWLQSLLGDGIIIGVGSLLTALPNIIILFFFLSIMEDTGYMARVAFLTDGLMHRLGLHGRSFIPMLMGFDCNVPAIMAAKDIPDPKERALTMLMVPFMSCSARLPVYVLFISIFFADHKALVLMSLYLLGILCSFAFALIMKHTRWFRKPEVDMVNELPDFHLPSAKSILGHIWYRVSDFLHKISTIVLFASIIIWALEYFPSGDLQMLEESWLAAIGQWIEPVMRPLGFDWKLSVCLMTGLPAKEAIGSTFAMLYGANSAAAAMSLTPVSAYAFLVFTLLYFPCVATIATIRRELNWKWATFTVVNSVVLAWVMAFVVNLIGNMIM
ncbi:MAG: ferrous iron transport protein B [Bacteroidales bacterium]|nr:ferrous iron transport protein B [Bacteroidales bacterium]